MKNAIPEVVNAIPKGNVFDSHYAISQLLKYHSDAYLTICEYNKSEFR